MKLQSRNVFLVAFCASFLGCAGFLNAGVASAASYKTAFCSRNKCFVPDASWFRKQDVTTVKVSVVDLSTVEQVTVKACVRNWTETSVSCGNQVTSGNSFLGNTDLYPPLSQWASGNAADFGYISITDDNNTEVLGVEYIKP